MIPQKLKMVNHYFSFYGLNSIQKIDPHFVHFVTPIFTLFSANVCTKNKHTVHLTRYFEDGIIKEKTNTKGAQNVRKIF